MSTLNKILNNALMETAVLKEEEVFKINKGGSSTKKTGVDAIDNDKPNAKDYVERVKRDEENQAAREKNKGGGSIGKMDTSIQKAKNFDIENPNAKYYATAGLAALGAGLGAVALARKLRAKKEAVKKEKK